MLPLEEARLAGDEDAVEAHAIARADLHSPHALKSVADMSPDKLVKQDEPEAMLNLRAEWRTGQRQKIDARAGDHTNVPMFKGTHLDGTPWAVPRDVAEVAQLAAVDAIVVPMLQRRRANRSLSPDELRRRAIEFVERQACPRCCEYETRSTSDRCGECGRWFLDRIKRENEYAAEAWGLLTKLGRSVSRRKTARRIMGNPGTLAVSEALHTMQLAISAHTDGLYQCITCGSKQEILDEILQIKKQLRYRFPHASLGRGRPTDVCDLLVREELRDEYHLSYETIETLRRDRPAFGKVLIGRSHSQHYKMLRVVADERRHALGVTTSVEADKRPPAVKNALNSRTAPTATRRIECEADKRRNFGIRTRSPAKPRAGRPRPR